VDAANRLFVVCAVAADVEPELAGHGEEPLQGWPVKFGCVLGSPSQYRPAVVGEDRNLGYCDATVGLDTEPAQARRSR
jgi:hypothetical protein